MSGRGAGQRQPEGPALRWAPCWTDRTTPPEARRPEEAPENASKREGTVEKCNRQKARRNSQGRGETFQTNTFLDSKLKKTGTLSFKISKSTWLKTEIIKSLPK